MCVVCVCVCGVCMCVWCVYVCVVCVCVCVCVVYMKFHPAASTGFTFEVGGDCCLHGCHGTHDGSCHSPHSSAPIGDGM